MGFSIAYGVNPLVVFLLLVPVVIVIVWLVRVNTDVRHELREEHEDEDIPLA